MVRPRFVVLMVPFCGKAKLPQQTVCHRQQRQIKYLGHCIYGFENMNKGKKIRFQVLTTGAMLLLTLQGFNYAHAAQIPDQQSTTAKPAEIKHDGSAATAEKSTSALLESGLSNLLGGESPEEREKGLNQIILAAELGDFEAQTTLARIYSDGKYVVQDETRTVYWYRVAAEHGEAGSQAQLAYRYRDGIGVIQDSVLAHMWANISAGNGSKAGLVLRDELSAEMTKGQLANAQQLARKCVAQKYKNCGT